MDTQRTKVITDHDVAQLVEQTDKQLASVRNKADIAKIVSLRLRHRKPYDEIAEELGINRETVRRALVKFTKFIEEPGELDAFRENKPDLFEAMEMKVLDMLHTRLSDPSYKPPIKDLANALKVLVEVRRLETGQSTDNVAVFMKSIENAHKGLFKAEPAKEPHVVEGRVADVS